MCNHNSINKIQKEKILCVGNWNTGSFPRGFFHIKIMVSEIFSSWRPDWEISLSAFQEAHTSRLRVLLNTLGTILKWCTRGFNGGLQLSQLKPLGTILPWCLSITYLPLIKNDQANLLRKKISPKSPKKSLKNHTKSVNFSNCPQTLPDILVLRTYQALLFPCIFYVDTLPFE